MLNYIYCIELQVIYSVIILLILLCCPFHTYIKILLCLIYMYLFYQTFYTYYWIVKSYIGIRKYKNKNIIFKERYIPNLFSKFTIKSNFDKLPSSNTIFVVNYPNQKLEYMLQCFFPRRLCLVASISGKKFISKIYNKEEVIYLDKRKNNYERLKRKIKQKINDYNIFVYINDNSTRYGEYHIGKLRKGVFYIAQELKITITPVFISYIEPTLGMISNNNIRISVGSTRKVENPIESIFNTRKFLQKKLTRFRDLQ